MKIERIIFGVIVALSIGVYAYAESCSSVGSTQDKYVANDPDECSYRMYTRTCCSNKTWSDWDKACQVQSNCTEGEVDEYSVTLRWANDGGVAGDKTCQKKCVNGDWVRTIIDLTCSTGTSTDYSSDSPDSENYGCILYTYVADTSYVANLPSGASTGSVSEGEECNDVGDVVYARVISGSYVWYQKHTCQRTDDTFIGYTC